MKNLDRPEDFTLGITDRCDPDIDRQSKTILPLEENPPFNRSVGFHADQHGAGIFAQGAVLFITVIKDFILAETPDDLAVIVTGDLLGGTIPVENFPLPVNEVDPLRHVVEHLLIKIVVVMMVRHGTPQASKHAYF